MYICYNVGIIWATGGRLNKKDSLTRYGNSHVKDKTAVRTLTWKSPYVDKTVFILRRGGGGGGGGGGGAGSPKNWLMIAVVCVGIITKGSVDILLSRPGR